MPITSAKSKGPSWGFEGPSDCDSRCPTNGAREVSHSQPKNKSVEIASSPRSFLDFIQDRRSVLDTPRGRFIARVRTLINAHQGPPHFTTLTELIRWMERRRFPLDHFAFARQLWREFETGKRDHHRIEANV